MQTRNLLLCAGVISAFACAVRVQAADTPYYFAARFFVPKDRHANLEGRLGFWGNPASGGRNRTWPLNIPDICLRPGKWNYVSAVVPAHSETDSLGLRFRLRNFEQGPWSTWTICSCCRFRNRGTRNE